MKNWFSEEMGFTIFGVAVIAGIAFGFTQAKACNDKDVQVQQACINAGGSWVASSCIQFGKESK